MRICNLYSSRGQVKKLNEFIENGTANDNSSDEKLKEQIKKFDEVLCALGKAEKINDRDSYNTRVAEIYERLSNKKLREFGNLENTNLGLEIWFKNIVYCEGR